MAYVDQGGTFHETYIASVFVGDTCLGFLTYDSGRADLHWNRFSLAYFCQYCGDVWARIVAQDERDKQRPFEVITHSCEKHNDLWDVPGSLLVGRIERLFLDFPPDAIRREFELHLKELNDGRY